MGKLVFYNLYIQTEYNFLSSTVSIKNLKNEMHRYEGGYLAIVDDAMYGAYKFYEACVEKNVRPIIGLRVKIYNENINNYVLLYAKDNNGYINLMRLSTQLQIERKGITLDVIQKYNQGIIAIIPFLENELKYYYENKNYNVFYDTLTNYQNTFEECFLGLSLQVSNYNVKEVIELASNKNMDAVAIHKVTMMKEDHLEAYKVLRNISKSSQNYEVSELEENSYFLTQEELLTEYQAYPELVQNQERIVRKCHVTIEFNGYLFPKYTLEEDNQSEHFDAEKYLANLCKQGLNKRIEQNRKLYNKDYRGKIEKYRTRLLKELDVIHKMGFDDYFLVVYDYVKYAKTHDILVGPGRGSGGGSLVCYSLGITDVDPIEYGLLFERFLNIERISMPDIDEDFQDNRRDEVIQYVGKRFGQNRVAHIATFGTLKPRLAMKDIARVKGTSDLKLKEIMNYIPVNSNLSFTKIIENSPILQRMIDTDDEVRDIINIALIIEDFPRNISTHAAGIIMAPDDLNNYTPLSGGLDGLMQTQYEASDLEKIGLVKMDILGLKNLTIIRNIINLVHEEHPDFDYNMIPMDDKATYEMLRRGETAGVFQLEADGVRKVLGSLQTSGFEDIVSATSLYRPGPMDNIPTFAARKLGKEKITYMDPSIEKVLKSTYGVIVYQEQIMLIASVFAGYTLGEADVLRRAISKKKASVMEQEKEKFVSKAVQNGKDKIVARKMFDYIEKFASYGFNRSHAVAYSVIAYKMAYLKVYFPEAYMCSILNNVIGDEKATVKYIDECKKIGIKVYPPSINKSEEGYIYKNKAILYPFLGIKGVGGAVVKKILDERDNGPFESYDDFLKRMKTSIDKKIVCALIYAGCFDGFKETRRSMVESYEDCLSRGGYDGYDLFQVKTREKSKEEFSFEEISLLEKGALGFNLKYDLFIQYLPYKQRYRTIDLNDLKEGVLSNVLFMIKELKEIKTKKGDDMAFITAYDGSSKLDAVIFPSNYSNVKNKMKVEDVVIAKGKLESKTTDGVTRSSFIIDNLFVIR